MFVCAIGLDVREVAHDCAVTVSEYISVELGLLNSYDTWHGKLQNKLVEIEALQKPLRSSYTSLD